jgi:hypothetical protein
VDQGNVISRGGGSGEGVNATLLSETLKVIVLTEDSQGQSFGYSTLLSIGLVVESV